MAEALGIIFLPCPPFQLPYAVFQVPAGMFGERFGARTALALTLLACAASSLLTGLLPGGDAAVGTLIGTRELLGLAQAAVFPVAAMAVMAYVPVGERVRATSIYIALSALGAGAAPLLTAPVMERFGWRAVFLLSAGLGFATALAWSVFRYLTEGRGFTVLASGMWGSVPSITGVVCAPLIGAGADRLGTRLGPPRARRRVAVGCLAASAACVAAGATLPSAYLAIAALSLSSGCLNSAEAPLASRTRHGRGHSTWPRRPLI